MFLQMEQKEPAPTWQRCFFACLVVPLAIILLVQFVDNFIVSPTPPSLDAISKMLFFCLFGLGFPARVVVEGKLLELSPEGKFSVWIRLGYGLGAAVSLVGEARILISVINGKTVLSTKDEVYLAFLIIMTCLFAYIAIRGKPFTRAPTPTVAATDSRTDSVQSQSKLPDGRD